MLSSSTKSVLARLQAFGGHPHHSPSLAPASSSPAAAFTAWRATPYTRRAAVLVILFETVNPRTHAVELSTVLTTRSAHLSSFSGQVALPGGKVDTDEETAKQAARREANEEINFPPLSESDSERDIQDIAYFPAYLSRNLLAVAPSIAYVPSPAVLPESYMGLPHVLGTNQELATVLSESGEVAEVFSVPLQHFLYTTHPPDSSNFHQTAKTPIANAPPWYEGEYTTWGGLRWWMHHFAVLRRTGKRIGEPAYFSVWGLTARILVDVARVAYAQPPQMTHNETVGDEALLHGLVAGGHMHQPRSKRDLAFSFTRAFGKDSPLLQSRL